MSTKSVHTNDVIHFRIGIFIILLFKYILYSCKQFSDLHEQDNQDSDFTLLTGQNTVNLIHVKSLSNSN